MQPSFSPSESSQPALAESHLRDLSVDAPQLHGVAVRQVVHGRQGDVEPRRGVVDGQDVDRPAVVRRAPARAAVGRVPPADGLGAANVREALHVLLGLPEKQPVSPCRVVGLWHRDTYQLYFHITPFTPSEHDTWVRDREASSYPVS